MQVLLPLHTSYDHIPMDGEFAQTKKNQVQSKAVNLFVEYGCSILHYTFFFEISRQKSATNERRIRLIFLFP